MDYLKELTGVDKQPWLFLKGEAATHWFMLVCLVSGAQLSAVCS